MCRPLPYYYHWYTVQKYIYSSVSKVHAGSFRVSVNHRTPTWTTGSLACVCDHSYACVYTQGLGTPTASQHNILDLEKLTNFSCAPDAICTRVTVCHRILRPMHYQLNHPVTSYTAVYTSLKFLALEVLAGFTGNKRNWPQPPWLVMRGHFYWVYLFFCLISHLLVLSWYLGQRMRLTSW